MKWHMNRLSSSQTDFAEVEASLRRIAEMVGNCIGRKFALRTCRIIGLTSGLTRWRAFIAEPGADFVSVTHFSWVPTSYSREDALLKLFSYYLGFFEVDSIEELELKLAVLGRKTVEGMLGIKERP